MPDEVRPEDLDGGFRPRPRVGVASVIVDGEAVLYDENTGALHVLNATATLLWQFFDGTATIDELVDDLAAVYQMDRELVATDVMAATSELGRSGVLDGVVPGDPDSGQDSEHDHGHSHGHDADGMHDQAADVEEPRFLTEPPSG